MKICLALLSFVTLFRGSVAPFPQPKGPVCDCPSSSFFHVCQNDINLCICTRTSTGAAEFACDFSACCGGNLADDSSEQDEDTSGDGDGRRLKKISFAIEDSTEIFDGIVDACGDFEYDGFLHVDNHFYAVAIPKEDAVAAGCPVLMSHADFNSEGTIAEKQIIAYDNKIGKELFEEAALPIGSFKLTELHRAYEETDPSEAGTYDVFTNSCARYVMDLAAKLGVEPDAKMTVFVARRLMETKSKALMDSIRNHPNFQSLFEGRNLRAVDVSDNEVISDLVLRT